ncbi:hypothetical protein H010_02882 [Hydrogenophaga taeniospiralis CCUG 15921]|uniref:Lipoprotein n=1 Tax=Hydrogenophaga taeniospiralis CCUG 15921 TaxID=1281780 RepID=A0A9X4S8P0_9BURK|nr:hypothetical protein [Hydrogenophaga taeniospiralis]MDG5974179.1 hypothetical protein [Hydrogenophaga taeniospiralis CCUG 15921]
MRSISSKHLLGAALVAALPFLAGCGGGGGGDDASTDLRQYTGLWTGSCVKTGSQSETQVLEFRSNASTASELSGSKAVNVYGNTSCSGSPKKVTWFNLTAPLAGTRETASGTAAMVMVQLSDANNPGALSSYTELLLLKDGRLYLGNRAALQADGYPADVDLSRAFTR